MTYTISYSNGERRDVSDMGEAESILAGCVIHDEWEPANFDGTRERKLVWASEDDADNDAGQNAIAEIIRQR